MRLDFAIVTPAIVPQATRARLEYRLVRPRRETIQDLVALTRLRDLGLKRRIFLSTANYDFRNELNGAFLFSNWALPTARDESKTARSFSRTGRYISGVVTGGVGKPSPYAFAYDVALQKR